MGGSVRESVREREVEENRSVEREYSRVLERSLELTVGPRDKGGGDELELESTKVDASRTKRNETYVRSTLRNPLHIDPQ